METREMSHAKSGKVKLAVMFLLLVVSGAAASDVLVSAKYRQHGHRQIQELRSQPHYFEGYRGEGLRYVGHRRSRGPAIHFGFSTGPFWGWPYPRYYGPVVIERVPPTVYIERTDDLAPTLPAGYWYYCSESEAYYPYVHECSGGWQQVPPRPAD